MNEVLQNIVPALYAALLNSVWQGVAAALVYVALCSAFRSYQAKYLLALTAFAALPTAFILTFGNAYLQSAASLPIETTRQLEGSRFQWYLAALWFIGATLLGLRLMGGWIWLQATIVRTAVQAPPEIQKLFETLRSTLKLSSRVCLRVSNALNTPVAVGVLRPMVLIPVSLLSGTPPDALRAILIHELSHLRRLDHIAVLFQVIGEALLFFHPAVWWLSKETRRLREYRCDSDSIEILGDKHAYAKVLLALEEQRSASYLLKLAMNGGDLMDRITKIYEPKLVARRVALGFTTLVLTVLMGITAVSLSYGEDRRLEAQEIADQRVNIRWLPSSVTQWRDHIEAAASRHQVPADMLALVLLAESNGDKDAVSRYGARGLMQVMPRTGQLIAARRGIDNFNPDQLLEPATNIDFGAWYLAEQMALFSEHGENALPLAVAAYNAGPRAVREHLSDGKALSEETARYRDTVMTMWNDRNKPHSGSLRKGSGKAVTQPQNFVMPVAGYISSGFGSVGKNSVLHTGTDIVAPTGTLVHSAIAGTVSTVGEDQKRGRFVVVEHADGLETRYYHMSKVIVGEDAAVEAGDLIGEVGSTGQSTGPHLHFEIRENGKPVSPLAHGFFSGT